ncbi:MAG: hypothetical protein ACRCTZ_22600, partial [Sarcina sp.]
TYTGKLAYVIYTDEKGKLRKEQSWNSWRDKDIPKLECKNEPLEGFVLNKKAGGYTSHWNTRQTYTRVYDPRGFEFEITIENSLYILENTNSIKGKGLEGEFVYGWSGKDLILIPTSSPDYTEMTKFSNIINENKTIKAKDLKIGGTYRTKQGGDWIYMGRYDYYKVKYGSTYREPYSVLKGKKYFFAVKSRYQDEFYFETISSVSNKLVNVIDENCVVNYSELFEKLKNKDIFTPINKNYEHIKLDKSTLEERFSERYYTYLYILRDGEYDRRELNINSDGKICIRDKNHLWCKCEYYSIDDLLDRYELYDRNIYLENGALYR